VLFGNLAEQGCVIKTAGIIGERKFSGKTHSVLLQIARKRVLVAVGLNKNSFYLHVKVSPFCITTNLRRNRFFWGKAGDW
ncbi:MAG: hypothetical protein ACFNVK_07445, partial [Prevotella sp.]